MYNILQNLDTLYYLKIFGNIIIFDCIGTNIIKYKLGRDNIPENARWFFIHFIINGIIVYYSTPLILTCLVKPNHCIIEPWTPDCYVIFWYCVMLHLYHSVFFTLNGDDIIHHVGMIGICGSLAFYNKTMLTTLSLFYLSGLPGFIDYFLLFLVKIECFKSQTQKQIYNILSNYIRAPGCTYIALLGVSEIYHFYTLGDYISCVCLYISNLLLFLNGSFYNFITLRSFYLKKNISYIK